MSTFGKLFRVTTFGESHCKGVGAIVEGCPPRLPLTEDDIQPQLTRRRPGQSNLTTQRDEKDRVVIQSGTEFGLTLGTPIGLFVPNGDQRPGDYSEMNQIPRPSHADYTYQQKYSIRAASGGGRSSARETIGRVAAGGIAEKWLARHFGVEIVSFVASVGEISMDMSKENLQEKFLFNRACTRSVVDQHPTRCPDSAVNDRMTALIEELVKEKDSIGGTVVCVVRNCPIGIGEPCFDKLEAKLGHAMMSIPATKGFEIGSGFEGTKMKGSAHNDMFCAGESSAVNMSTSTVLDGVLLKTKTNFSGGVQGGISNGQDIWFRCAFKPPATIGKAQDTARFDGEAATLAAKGRHDPCVVPRAVPIVEAMAALVIIDATLEQLARQQCMKMEANLDNLKFKN